jgi:hypothetical protein
MLADPIPMCARQAFLLLKFPRSSCEQPRLRRLVTDLEGADFVGVPQGQADVAETVEQTVLAVRIVGVPPVGARMGIRKCLDIFSFQYVQ